MLLEAGAGNAEDIARATETSHGSGLFVRSLVGLERAAVQAAFGEFLSAGTATAAPMEFINMVVEHLTDQGTLNPERLYEPPFTDIAPTDPDRLFDEAKVAQLFTRIQAINRSAVAWGGSRWAQRGSRSLHSGRAGALANGPEGDTWLVQALVR